MVCTQQQAHSLESPNISRSPKVTLERTVSWKNGKPGIGKF